jgi:hypothetical protein
VLGGGVSELLPLGDVSALGIELDDLIVGFIYVGTEIGNPATRAPRSVHEFTEHWTGGRAIASPA